MKWNRWIRQSHRWLSMAFTLIVAAIFLLLGTGAEPAEWIYYLPLFPLALLMMSGLYLFALPYVGKRRTGGPTAATE